MTSGEGAATDTRLFTRAFTSLTVAELAYFTALGILIPVTPLFAAGALGAGEFAIGLTIGAFSVTAVILRPWAGRRSDRQGRRPLLIAGALLFAIATLGHVLVSDIVVLTVLRLVLGVADAMFFVAAFATLADLAPPGRAGEAVSFNSLALYLGIAFGPLIGEVLVDAGGFDTAFIGAALLGFVCLLLVLTLPETRSGQEHEAGGTGEPAALIHRGAIGPGLALFAGVAAMSGFLAFVALYSRELGMEGARYVLLAFGLVVVGLRITLSKLPDRVAPLKLTTLALALTSLGIVIAGMVASPEGLFIGAIITAVGVAFLTPAVFAFLMGRVLAAERGTAMGTTTMFLDLSFGLGPMVFGLVAAGAGFAGAFVAGAAIAAAGAIGTAWVAWPRRRAELQPDP